MWEPEPVVAYLLPWEFSPAWAIACLVAAGCYLRGLQRQRSEGQATGVWRPLAFLLGIGGVYAVTQTHYDYLSQFMFFTHRAQHLVLHHAAPFLIALAAPLPVLAAGMPRRWQVFPGWHMAGRAVRPLYQLLQQPVVAALVFVGLIYFWLIPEIHFDAMLSRQLYQVMNWSMLLDGLLFWWLMLDPRTPQQGGLGYGTRILVMLAVILPQVVLGSLPHLQRKGPVRRLCRLRPRLADRATHRPAPRRLDHLDSRRDDERDRHLDRHSPPTRWQRRHEHERSASSTARLPLGYAYAAVSGAPIAGNSVGSACRKRHRAEKRQLALS